MPLPQAGRGAGIALLILALALALALGAVLLLRTAAPSPAAREAQAERFVALALALGRIAPNEVDSYFGPSASATPAGAPPPLATIGNDAAALAEELRGADDPRSARLADRTQRLATLIDVMTRRTPLPFDEEARRLYGLQPTLPDRPDFVAARAALDRLLPGPGPLTARVEAYRARFVIPEERRPALFERALAECRRRTQRHWPLPPSEQLEVEWTATVGAAWHRYRGGYRSTLQINRQAVAFLGSAVDVACHEGYPGHHTQFLLAESAAGPAGLPTEDRVVLLRSPASALREGAAEAGVALALPPAERLAFERDVLFPLAGLPPSEAARYSDVGRHLAALGPAALPILRAYRDGKLDSDAAAAALDAQALIASPASLLGFVDTLGAYAVGYTAARAQVQATIARGAGDAARWAVLRCLITAADAAPLEPGRAPCQSATGKPDR